MPIRVEENMDMVEVAKAVNKEVKGAGGRILEETYKSTGNEALDTLAFLHLLEQLKKRSGWIREGVESVGDITPVEGVPAHVKHELEEQAMDSFLNEMLGGEGNRQARERFRSLWDARETPESKLVKDLDRLELALQAVEYERSQDVRTLHPFFTGSIPHLEHPSVRAWGETLMAERRELWATRGRADEERAGLNGAMVGSKHDGPSV